MLSGRCPIVFETVSHLAGVTTNQNAAYGGWQVPWTNGRSCTPVCAVKVYAGVGHVLHGPNTVGCLPDITPDGLHVAQAVCSSPGGWGVL